MSQLSITTQRFPKGGKTRLEKSWALIIIRKWKARLRLEHWTVQISNEPPGDLSHHMEIHMWEESRVASIRIKDSAWALSATEFEKKIVHELVHIYFNAVYEENGKQLLWGKNDRILEYKFRMMGEIEKSVEPLAQILYSAYAR